MTTQLENEAHLSDVVINQLTWKPTTCQQIAISIVNFFVHHPHGFHFTDEADLSFVDSDSKNCIGTAWKRLTTQGIIERGNNFRRSTSEHSAGRTIFDYRLASVARAKTFLQRNNVKINDSQAQLFPIPEPQEGGK